MVMPKSQRTISKIKIAQAMKFMDSAMSVFYSAISPYFERFPDKELAAQAVLESMEALKGVIKESFHDI